MTATNESSTTTSISPNTTIENIDEQGETFPDDLHALLSGKGSVNPKVALGDPISDIVLHDCSFKKEVHATQVKKKKRKNNRKKKAANAPSGFEEYIIEGPLTKEQAEDELTLYSPAKPFTERIEICIQRYRQRRKWDEWRLQVFETYLHLGGISTGPKMFVGQDPRKFEDMDAEEIATLTATDYVQRPDDDWDVDFVWIVRGFLSYRVPYVLCYNTDEKLGLACGVIKNFLNYVTYHNVCPEFAESINKAITLCDIADRELGLCKMVSNAIPGKYHLALSVLHNGSFSKIIREDFGSEEPWDKDIITTRVAGLTKVEAQTIFKAALAIIGTPVEKQEGLLAFVKEVEYMSLEVTEIILPPDESDIQYSGLFTGSERLGRIRMKTWNPDEPDEEVPNSEMIEFWLEKPILQLCFLKMHIDCKVYTLNTGMRFFDSTTAVMCSFYLKLDPPDGKIDSDDDDEYE